MLAELLRDPLPTRMRRQVGEARDLPRLVDRTLPCTVDVISLGCLKVPYRFCRHRCVRTSAGGGGALALVGCGKFEGWAVG